MVVWNEFLNDARVLKEAQTLQRAGYVVTVFALHTPGVTRRYETTSDGIKIIRVIRSPFWGWRKKLFPSGAARASKRAPRLSGNVKQQSIMFEIVRFVSRSWTHLRLCCLIASSRPAVIHSHDVNTLPTSWLASVVSRAPLVYDAHEISTAREGYSGVRRIVGFVEKVLLPRVAAVITTTDTRATYLARAYKIARPVVLQNRPRFVNVHRNDKIRARLGLVNDWPIVLYQGGLQQGRGLERIVDVAKELESAYFVFVGGGRLRNQLNDRVRSLGVEQRVFFIDTVSLDELPTYTASADVGVQAIENTCFNHFSTDSNKVFEYVMAGLPVVASNFPEIRKLIGEYKFGLLVEPGDSMALKDALGLIIANESLRNAFSERAHIAKKDLNWESQEEKLIDLYSRVSGCF